MCITALALEGHPSFPFILVHTRDEEWERPTEPVREHEGGVVYARDLRAGGTFLGLNLRSSAFGAITNTRSHVPRPTGEPSRGALVASAIRDEPLDMRAYSAFNLHHGTVQPPEASFSCSWPGADGKWQYASSRVPSGKVSVHSNEPSGDQWDDSWPKTSWMRRRISALLRELPTDASAEALRGQLAALLSESVAPAPHELPDLSFSSLPPWKEAELQNGPFVSRDRLRCTAEEQGETWGYGTVCQTIIVSCAESRTIYFSSRSLHNEQQAPEAWRMWQMPWSENC